MDDTKKKFSKRGFGSMTKEQQRAIASKGGKMAHAKGVAHKWNSETARKAGKIGGRARQKQLQNA